MTVFVYILHFIRLLHCFVCTRLCWNRLVSIKNQCFFRVLQKQYL